MWTIILTFLKRHWLAILLIVAGVVGYLYFRSRVTSLTSELQKTQQSRDAEVKKITDAVTEERKLHDAEVKKLGDALEKVQKTYEDQIRDLEARKQVQIVQIVKDYNGDPDGLAKALAKATGFQYLPNP